MEKSVYNSALEFATKKHEGQFRKGGAPYITHPVAVAEILREKGYSEEYLVTALFHDLLEDTDAAESEILAIGGEKVLNAVKLLTKEQNYNMAEYVSRIRANEIAFAVKAADRLHNLRSAFCTDKKFKGRYIDETREWYMDFCPEIPELVDELEKTL